MSDSRSSPLRRCLPLAVVAFAACAMCAVLAAKAAPDLLGWTLLLWLAMPAAAVVQWREYAREQRSLDAAIAQLAEFRLPLPECVRLAMPLALQQLVRGYDETFSEMQRRELALIERVDRYAFMEMHTEDVVIQTDSRGRVKYVSPSIQQDLGYTPDELIGLRMLDLLHPDERTTWLASLKNAARARKAALLEGRWRHRDGHYVALEMSLRHAHGLNGSVVETIGISRNVETRNELRDKLTRAAHTDHLTGLPNRAALVPTLERFRATSLAQPFVLFLFDLDRFKQVNDSLGHAAGDAYLIETANRVRSILRPGDTLARMGGDEFVALFEGIDSDAGARSIAARIIDAVSQPFSCHGALLHPKTSIGIVVCSDPELPSDELISRADRAMYAAKRQGGNHAIVYDASHSDSMRKDFDVEQALTLALQQDRLVLHFQPIVDTRTKQPVLAEALVRMRAEDGTLLGPGYFIDVAEKTGQIFQVGQWVFEEACLHARSLIDAGTPMTISVNVSPRQLMHVNYAQSVETVLQHTGVPPSSIVLELTESAVMENIEKAKATLNHLRALGLRLALDDFGTGYSSISMLKTLPFDILKIDRSFVRDIGGLTLGTTTLGAIIDIGKSLKLTIIAEGVETAEQSFGLERMGCDLLQGFRFFRPMDAAAHAKVLHEGRAELRTPERLPMGDTINFF